MKLGGKTGSYKALERIVRGFANHRRIQIMDILNSQPELSVAEIADKLKINFKTASQHVTRLAIAGLVMKRSDGTRIRHKLTARGERALKYLESVEF